MLVVMEDRDLQALAQPALDLEVLWSLDVLQVDAAEGGLEGRDDIDQLVGIGFVQFDIEHIDPGELLEQATLALHHRLGSERSDVAEAEHRRAVRDHGHEVGPAGIQGGGSRIGMDGHAGSSDTWGVGQGQIALIGHALDRQDGNLSWAGKPVVLQGAPIESLDSAVIHVSGARIHFLAHGATPVWWFLSAGCF